MNINIDKKSKTPVYLQIVNQLKAQIKRGDIIDGSTLPSERALSKVARLLQVSPFQAA